MMRRFPCRIPLLVATMVLVGGPGFSMAEKNDPKKATTSEDGKTL